MLSRDTFSYLLMAGFDLMSSAIATVGSIVVQVGDAVHATTDSDRAEWWQHTGFRSRPADPTPGSSSCQGLAMRRGDHDMVFASKDERASSMWADLGPDEAEIYSFGGQCRVVVRKNGNVEIHTSGTVSVGDSGSQVTLSGGGTAVARNGDTIQISNAQWLAAAPTAPSGGGPVTITNPIQGTITSGSSNVSSS